MSLRDALRQSVARCTPQYAQHATGDTGKATGAATLVQPPAAAHSAEHATARATAMQSASCIGAPRSPSDVAQPGLVATINAACAARGDDESNRLALIAECSALPLAMQADIREHFAEVARIWQRAQRW